MSVNVKENGNLTKVGGLYIPSQFPHDDTKADQDSITNVENGTTASQAYSVGDFFYRNGDFCVVTASIASGSPLTENTNYVVTKVGDYLTRVKQENNTSNSSLRLLLSTTGSGDTTEIGNAQKSIGLYFQPSSYLMTHYGYTRTPNPSATPNPITETPVSIRLSTRDTDANVSNHSYIRAYSPHSGTGGNNLLIHAQGRLILGGGESAQNLYNAMLGDDTTMTGEQAYLCADSALYLYANCGTIANRLGFAISTSGNLIPMNQGASVDNFGKLGVIDTTNPSNTKRLAEVNTVDVNATNINGVAVGATPKFTDTTYSIMTDGTQGTITLNGSDGSSVTKSIPEDYDKADESTIGYVNAKGGTIVTDTARKAYSRGDFFYHKGKLYQATDDIAISADLTSNNCKEVSVTDFLTPKSGNITVNSGVSSWLSLTTNGNKCYRSGNHVKFIARFTITDMPSTYSSSPDILTLPWRAYRTASTEYQFYPIVVYSVPYPIYDNGSAWIYNRNSIRISKEVMPNGTYTICGDYITDDPI